MDKKIIISAIAIGIVAIGGIIMFNTTNQIDKNENTANSVQNNSISTTQENKEPAVKEFSMTSFVEMVNGTPKLQFSLKEITVNKGDKVRIKITVTSGTHDFKIDEFNVYADTQLNKEYVVEFTADKTGEFIYYCAKPGHRQNGQWGTLKVI